MSEHPVDQFLHTVKQSKLLPEVDWEKLSSDLKQVDLTTQQQVALSLVERHLLTQYQAEKLLQGQADECIIADRYHILEKVGTGGMGAVFRARDTQLNREVAIKIMLPHRMDSPDAVERFKREARALAALALPDVVKAFDSGEDRGRNYLVMEYVQGLSLDKLLKEKGKVPPSIAADYVYRVALSMYQAHARGMIHRDLKPSNLLLTPDGDVKILDLGLARFLEDYIGDSTLTRDQASLGTPDYMSPEQFRDAKRVDHRADVYSLGCTLYHLLSGQVPFPGSSMGEKWEAHENKTIQPLREYSRDVPIGLEYIVSKMMAKRPEDRYHTMRDVAEALAAHVAGSSPSLPSAQQTVTYLAQKNPGTAKRWRWFVQPVLMTAVLVLGCLGLYGIYTWSNITKTKQEQIVKGPDKSGNVRPKKKVKQKLKPNPEPKQGQPEKQPQTEPKRDTPTPKPPVPKVPMPKPPPGPKVVTFDNGLTVAQDGTGQYKTLGEALTEIKSGQMIRVLDDAIYEESLQFTSNTRLEGVTLEAVNGATLLAPPGTKNLIEIVAVPKVTLRGFRLKSNSSDLAAFVWVRGNAHGVVIEKLKIESTNSRFVGIEVGGETGSKVGKGNPILIRNNLFRDLNMAIILIGHGHSRENNYQKSYDIQPCKILNNDFQNCSWGVRLQGKLDKVLVAENRIVGATKSALHLENLLDGAKDILITNNTAAECRRALVLWDDAVKGENIQFCSNLFLNGTDVSFQFLDSGGTDLQFKGDGDGKVVNTENGWTFRYNVREQKAQKPTGKAWIPPGKDDFVLETVQLESRIPGQPDYLRPPTDSKLATTGAGKTDPAFPTWIGAVPPKDADPWDWQWTWDAHFSDLLTVSQHADKKARFRSIKDALDMVSPGMSTIKKALDVVRPGMTVRVIDNGVYKEAVQLTQTSQFSGLTLEATNGATIAAPDDVSVGNSTGLIKIANVHDLTIRGFTITGGKANLRFIYAEGDCSGLLLENLKLECTYPPTTGGIFLYQLNSFKSSAPIVIRKCFLRGFEHAILIDGINKLSDGKGGAKYGHPSLCRSIRIEENTLQEVAQGINAYGLLEDIQIVGNIIRNANRCGLQIEHLVDGTKGVLFANNTTIACKCGFRVWNGDKFLGKQIRVTNNLLLSGVPPDVLVFDSGGNPGTPKGMGNPIEIQKFWEFDHNWRETKIPRIGPLSKGWIPPQPKKGDLVQDNIEVLSRDSRDTDFLRPPTESGLATKGAGTKDTYLPRYVGAVPPLWTDSWDWDVTWKARTKAEKSD